MKELDSCRVAGMHPAASIYKPHIFVKLINASALPNEMKGAIVLSCKYNSVILQKIVLTGK
jgi:hypothetical protein